MIFASVFLLELFYFWLDYYRFGINLLLLFMVLQNPHLLMYDPLFTVGQSHQCHLWLKDLSVSKVLCKLSHIEVEFPVSSVLLYYGKETEEDFCEVFFFLDIDY